MIWRAAGLYLLAGILAAGAVLYALVVFVTIIGVTHGA